MVSRRVTNNLKGPLRLNQFITLGQRIRYLRNIQKPFMTQMQLAHLAGLNLQTVTAIENDRHRNMKLSTLRKIGNALGCRVYFILALKPSHAEGACLPVGPELPPPPKRSGKISVQART